MRKTVYALSLFLAVWVDLVFANEVAVSQAWTRASAPGQSVAGVYFDIQSGADARLVGVTTPLTGTAEIHLMSMDDGVMRMRAVQAVELPAGETVSFRPGGYHVMLFGLQQPLKAGEQIPLDLLVETGNGATTRVKVAVEVRNLDGSKAP